MEKTQYFKIGEIAKTYNISVQTLRHYEEIGLLKPAYIDTNTHYRYYSYEQTEILNTIRYLRALGTPLDSIHDFLNNRSLSKMKIMLEKQNDEIEKQMQILQRAQRKIKRRIEILEKAKNVKCNIIHEYDAPQIQYTSLQTTLHPTSYLDLESSILSLEKDQQETIVYLGNVGIGITPKHLINNKFDQYDSVFIILNPEDISQKHLDIIPAIRTLSITFNGNHTSSKPIYTKLMKYIEEHGYEPAYFSREITLIDEGLTSDTTKYLTQIEIPVTRRRKK